VTAEGSVHRVYPAPAPVGGILNPDAGWDDYDAPPKAEHKGPQQGSSPTRESGFVNRPGGGWDEPSASPLARAQTRPTPGSHGARRDAPPHMSASPDTAPETVLQTPASTAYIKWEPVV
jgi:hypothetical protein